MLIAFGAKAYCMTYGTSKTCTFVYWYLCVLYNNICSFQTNFIVMYPLTLKSICDYRCVINIRICVDKLTCLELFGGFCFTKENRASTEKSKEAFGTVVGARFEIPSRALLCLNTNQQQRFSRLDGKRCSSVWKPDNSDN